MSEQEDYDNCCEAGVEEGEICLYPNMPWLHETIGSQMERQLTQYKDGQCRWCGKPCLVKDIARRFCNDKCSDEWVKLRDLRLQVGKHDLRRRGFD
jgi:hypothetical protein